MLIHIPCYIGTHFPFGSARVLLFLTLTFTQDSLKAIYFIVFISVSGMTLISSCYVLSKPQVTAPKWEDFSFLEF